MHLLLACGMGGPIVTAPAFAPYSPLELHSAEPSPSLAIFAAIAVAVLVTVVLITLRQLRRPVKPVVRLEGADQRLVQAIEQLVVLERSIELHQFTDSPSAQFAAAEAEAARASADLRRTQRDPQAIELEAQFERIRLRVIERLRKRQGRFVISPKMVLAQLDALAKRDREDVVGDHRLRLTVSLSLLLLLLNCFGDNIGNDVFFGILVGVPLVVLAAGFAGATLLPNPFRSLITIGSVGGIGVLLSWLAWPFPMAMAMPFFVVFTVWLVRRTKLATLAWHQ